MTKTTPKRNRAKLVAVIEHHLMFPVWSVRDMGSLWTVERNIIAIPTDAPAPALVPDKLYHWFKSEPNAKANARYRCAMLNAVALADAIEAIK